MNPRNHSVQILYPSCPCEILEEKMLFIMIDSHRGLQPSPPHGNPGLDQAWGGSGLYEKPKARGVGLIPHPVTALACGPGRVAGPEAGWVICMAAALTLQEVLSEVEVGRPQRWSLLAQGCPLLQASAHLHNARAQTLDPRPLRPHTWQNLQRRQHQVS